MIYDSILKKPVEFNSPHSLFGVMASSKQSAVGGWKEVARTTLGSSGTTLNVTSIPDKRYYMILNHFNHSSAARPQWRYNSSTGSPNAYRMSRDGAADLTGINVADILWSDGGAWGTGDDFVVKYISNLASKEKLVQGHHVAGNTAGAANVPHRVEGVGKWAETTNSIDEINYVLQGFTNTFGIGSEAVVLGWDENDTHTDNFWEELASVDTGAGAILDSGTITAKKYLWVQFFAENDSGTSMELKFRFNSDTATNYARRNSQNGAADNTQASNNGISVISSGNKKWFGNYFIINKSANEKLVTGHNIGFTTAGAGVAPNRNETVGKWNNTTAQITKIQIVDTAQGDLGLTQGKIRVFGAD